ncbi:MAG: hypothetical protein A2W90_12175 [Bacteroidetes bacterium GWF2_42_66]|nr:MAG: hypothetical protein A2W92_23250 [Bacteroidetes bacterium GWA2_42_15]OFX99947.1 MAG: hypothetical protein A2W89_17160 [Bacteroidetes bacterium GWE2_42_39]OFY40132.1 MAG: hypothetical protein A2W90_12175 [Bacteroidetes bacterium GWF2_42_66]HBL73956.1 hypothetical protein [Prolixibacteraceae bacterium]HCR89234.1 hypothetical protein [Prolixibacteraceae bacterium]
MKASYLVWFFYSIFFPLIANSQTIQLPDIEAYRDKWTILRPELDTNIERYRKGDVAIEVVDENGDPIREAKLVVKQKTHEFLFGCNILWLGQLGEKNELYENAFAKLFNLATTTFCLSEYRLQDGQYRFEEDSKDIFRRPPVDRVLAFGKKYDIKLKGQPLLADSWHPVWAKDMTTEEAHELYKDYFKTVADRYGDDFFMFDVVNEAFLCEGRNTRRGWDFPLYTDDLSYAGWAFGAAQPLFPKKCILSINEATGVNTSESERYFEFIKNIFNKGCDIDGIGFQFHLFNNESLKSHIEGKEFVPSQLIDTYNKFQYFNRPLYITEITIPTTLAKGVEGEKIQAEILSNLYRLWFSIPAMAGITYWNLCDGVAWKNEGDAKAGLLDEDMLEKPAYQALYQLIQREWNTRLTTQTNLQGKADFRGFYGKYDITVIVEEKSQTFEIDILKGGSKINRITFK